MLDTYNFLFWQFQQYFNLNESREHKHRKHLKKQAYMMLNHSHRSISSRSNHRNIDEFIGPKCLFVSVNTTYSSIITFQLQHVNH